MNITLQETVHTAVNEHKISTVREVVLKISNFGRFWQILANCG